MKKKKYDLLDFMILGVDFYKIILHFTILLQFNVGHAMSTCHKTWPA